MCIRDSFISHYGSLQSVVDNTDNIIFYPGCDSMEDVARYFAEEYGSLGDIPPQLSYYIDYQAYGRDLEIEGCFPVSYTHLVRRSRSNKKLSCICKILLV